MKQLAILYVGASLGTCLQRADSLRALGHDLAHVPSDPPMTGLRHQAYRVAHKLRRPFDDSRTNARMLAALGRRRFDLLWIDKGNTVRRATFAAARRVDPRLLIVG